MRWYLFIWDQMELYEIFTCIIYLYLGNDVAKEIIKKTMIVFETFE